MEFKRFPHNQLQWCYLYFAWKFPALNDQFACSARQAMISMNVIVAEHTSTIPLNLLFKQSQENRKKALCVILIFGWFAGFHHMVSQGQGTVWQSLSLSRSNTQPLSSSWNPSTPLALVFELWRHHLPSDAVLSPAVSLITGRLVEGGKVLFLPIQVQRTCPLPQRFMSSF